MPHWRGRRTTGIILPGYARFDDTARAFAGEAEALCKAPSQAALDDARAAARAALLAWGRIEPLRFGPMMQKQRFERLLFYPDQHGIVAKQTAKLLAKRDEADIEPEKLAGASVAVQGFGAVDAVLYGKARKRWRAAAGGVVPLPLRARACRRYRADRRRDARRMGRRLQQQWLAAGRRQQDLPVAKETTQALYRAYATEIEVIRAQTAAGIECGEPWRMRKRRAKAPAGNGAAPLLPHSGLGLPFILATIEGARDILGPSGFVAADLAGTDKERSAIAILGSVATDLGFALRAGEAAVAMAPDPLPTTRRARAWRPCCCR